MFSDRILRVYVVNIFIVAKGQKAFTHPKFLPVGKLPKSLFLVEKTFIQKCKT